MEIYKGWYRKSLTRGRWHRVCHVDSIMDDRQMAGTVCYRRIPATKCDFDNNPNNKCAMCEKMDVGEMVDKLAISTKRPSVLTKKSAVAELKRLLKPRIYYIRIWEREGIQITAKWESDVSISIYTEYEIITNRRKKNILGLGTLQTRLDDFKSRVDSLCKASDELALEEKKEKKLKGRLTEDEKNAYFEELMYEAEK